MLKQSMKAIPLAAAALLLGSGAWAGGAGPCASEAKAPTDIAPAASVGYPADALIIAQDKPPKVEKPPKADKPPKEEKPPKADKPPKA